MIKTRSGWGGIEEQALERIENICREIQANYDEIREGVRVCLQVCLFIPVTPISKITSDTYKLGNFDNSSIILPYCQEIFNTNMETLKAALKEVQKYPPYKEAADNSLKLDQIYNHAISQGDVFNDALTDKTELITMPGAAPTDQPGWENLCRNIQVCISL